MVHDWPKGMLRKYCKLNFENVVVIAHFFFCVNNRCFGFQESHNHALPHVRIVGTLNVGSLKCQIVKALIVRFPKY